MRVAIGGDHAGFRLKEAVKRMLVEIGVQVEDVGTSSTDSVDYPDFALKVCEDVKRGKVDRGVLVCSTGVGMSMAANKVPGIRAALCHTVEQAELSRTHNDANILCLGQKATDPETARQIVQRWFSTDFSGAERHVRRLGKIAEIERRMCR